MDKSAIGKVVLLIGIIGILLLISYVMDTKELLDREAMQAAIEENLMAGVITFIAVAVLLKLLFTPIIPVSIAAGFLFGGLLGTIVSLISITIGAVIPFFLARALGSDFVHRFFRKRSETLKAYGAFMERHGLIAVILFRVVPMLPNMVVNLGFGLTRVRAREFILGTILGSLPGSFLLANFGDTVTQYAKPQPYIFAALYIGLVLITAVVGYRIKTKVDAKEDAQK